MVTEVRPSCTYCHKIIRKKSEEIPMAFPGKADISGLYHIHCAQSFYSDKMKNVKVEPLKKNELKGGSEIASVAAKTSEASQSVQPQSVGSGSEPSGLPVKKDELKGDDKDASAVAITSEAPQSVQSQSKEGSGSEPLSEIDAIYDRFVDLKVRQEQEGSEGVPSDHSADQADKGK